MYRRLRFVLDIVHRLLEEGRLDRSWLREVMRQDRHRILSGTEGPEPLQQGFALIDRWLDAKDWMGDLEAIFLTYEAGRIAVELVREMGDELPERVVEVVTAREGRLSLPGAMALLALVGGVEHRTARWQFHLLDRLYQQLEQEMTVPAEDPGGGGRDRA